MSIAHELTGLAVMPRSASAIMQHLHDNWMFLFMTASTHQAHGLSGEHTQPDWPPLSVDEVSVVLLRRPAIGTLQEITWRSPRPMSAAALVQTSRGSFFIKRHHRRVRTARTLVEEHHFIAHLQSRGLPVPTVIPDHDGHTVSSIGDWVYEVLEPVAGIDLYRDTLSWQPLEHPSHAHAAGRMLATLHEAAHDYHAPQRQTHILVARSELIRAVDPVAALQAQLPHRPALADYLKHRDWAKELTAAMNPWHARAQSQLASLPTLWTHGDWHASNLSWSIENDRVEVRSVFDFGLSALNFALFDLATAIERNAIAWLDLDANAAKPEIARALIAGYREHLKLSTADIQLLGELLPLVHVDFALSEVGYYHAITRSKANADLAYEGFLLGHAAWFRSDAGQALLDAIRACA